MSPDGLVTARWETLVLARLASQSSAQTAGDLANALRLTCAALPGWRDRVDAAVDALAETALVRRDDTRRMAAFSATPEGTKELARRLQVSSSASNLRWQTQRDKHLVAVALDLVPLDARARRDFPRLVCAEVARVALDLEPEGRLTFSRLRDAACRSLLERGYGWAALPERTSVRGEVGRRLLATLLGDATSRLSEDKLIRALAVRALRCSRATDVGPTILRRWLEGVEIVSRGSLAPQVTAAVVSLAAPGRAGDVPARAATAADAAAWGDPSDAALRAFAERVVTSSRAYATGKPHGEGKIFISHARRAYSGSGERAMDDATFKQWLALANNRSLLRLARADLLAAFDPADVRDSKTEHRGAEFHFVRLD